VTAGRATRILRAAACAVVLAALIAGLPAALYKLGGNPIPRHLPSWRQVTAILGRRDDGTLFLAAVRDLSWAGWAAFTLSALLEAAARVRGRPAPRLPALGTLQSLAATLLTATIAAAPAAPALPALTPALLAHRAPAAAAPPFPRTAAAAGDATLTAARAGAGPHARQHDLVHTVVAGDNLWDLARTYLGSGERWHQIYTLNHGRPQPGGGTLTDPARIYPGWRLLIPATGPHPQQGHGHPPGHRRPARHRRVPAPSPAATSPGPARTPHPPRGTHATARPGTAQPGHQDGVRLPSGALIGLTTAAAVSAALAAARIHRRRRYRPGPLTSSLEPAAQPPPVITALDRAARHPGIPAAGPFPGPGTSADDTGTDPDLDLYEPCDHGYRDEPAAAYPGSPEPAPALLSGPPLAGQDGPPPGPGQIPVGIRDGQEISADIAALGGLGLTGPGAPAAARAILAGLLSRPPHGPGRAPAAIIIPAGAFGQLLPAPGGQPAHPPLPGISVPATLEAALDELETVIVARARTTDTADDDRPAPAPVVLIAAPGPAAAHRLRGITDAGPDLGTAVILLGDWPHGTTCRIAGDGLITGVTPPDAGLAGTQAYHLAAADLTAITAQLAEASRAPGEQDSPPAPGQPRLLTAPQPGPAPAPAPAATAPGAGQQAAAAPRSPEGSGGASTAGTPVQISVLGPLQITAAGREIGSGPRKARELLAFLAVRGADGATGEEISEALWPGAPARHGTRQRHIALFKARELLRGATGLTEPMWITLTADRYRLDPALTGADLWQFQSALETARTAADDQARLAALRQAVACYRGPLCDGAGYDWAEPHAETARRRALDAWARIAEILQPADPEHALTALEAALIHDPYNEYTYQQIMRLQAAQGRPDAVRRTLVLLENKLGQIDAEPAAGTRQLAAALLGTGKPRHGGGNGAGDGNSGSPPGQEPHGAAPPPGHPSPGSPE
jgi:DNA-binding SARP family transcriptional activator